MKKLNIDNPFFEFMGNLGDWLILNVLFVLSCIPVVTVGTAITALYQVSWKLMEGKSGYVVREYARDFRKEWKKSTEAWLLLLAAGALLLFDVLYAGRIWTGFLVAAVCMLVIWGLVFCYTFPLLAQFENSLKNTMKNALYLSVRHFPFTMVIVVLNALPAGCIFWGAFPMALAAPVYCAFGFALTARVNGGLFRKIFRPYMEERKIGI